jgi:predicted alpha/beta hydrolase family esterase
MKLLFLHGLDSKPDGSKVKFLKKQGHEVLNPFLPKYSWGESLENAQTLIDSERPDIIIGSSRGGAVALSVNTFGANLILIAPAWKRFGGNPQLACGGVVIHCLEDEEVPYEDSEELCGITGAQLIMCGNNHRMNDADAFDGILDALKWIQKNESR